MLTRNVVLDKHDLRSYLQHQFFLCRVHINRKIPLHLGTENLRLSCQLLQAGSVQIIGLLVVGREIDVTTGLFGSKVGQATAVQAIEYRDIHPIVTDTVQQVEKLGIALTINFGQLHRHITGLRQRMAAEEIEIVIIGRKQLLVLLLDNRRKLLQIAYHEQLDTAKGLMTVAVAAQDVVHGVEQVGAHHADFINDQQIETTQDVDLLLTKTILILGFSSEMRFGHKRCERQLKERMDGNTTRIHGCHTRRS